MTTPERVFQGREDLFLSILKIRGNWAEFGRTVPHAVIEYSLKALNRGILLK
jgi:hypothetical protein